MQTETNVPGEILLIFFIAFINMIAVCVAHSHACKGIPGTCKKFDTESCSETLNDLHSLEDEQSYKMMYFLYMIVKHFKIIK